MENVVVTSILCHCNVFKKNKSPCKWFSLHSIVTTCSPSIVLLPLLANMRTRTVMWFLTLACIITVLIVCLLIYLRPLALAPQSAGGGNSQVTTATQIMLVLPTAWNVTITVNVTG